MLCNVFVFTLYLWFTHRDKQKVIINTIFTAVKVIHLKTYLQVYYCWKLVSAYQLSVNQVHWLMSFQLDGPACVCDCLDQLCAPQFYIVNHSLWTSLNYWYKTGDKDFLSLRNPSLLDTNRHLTELLLPARAVNISALLQTVPLGRMKLQQVNTWKHVLS